MWRRTARNVLPDLNVSWARSSATVTTADRKVDALPFSEVPTLPTVPILRGLWAYLPIVGKYNILASHKAALDKHRKYGNIYKEELTKEITMIAVHDPKDLEKVYRMEGKFPDRQNLSCLIHYREKRKHIYSNAGLLTSQGEQWYDVRAQVQPHMMKPKTIHAHLGAMDEVSKEMVDKIALVRSSSDNEVPDLIGELYKWALEAVALVALDTRLGCLKPVPQEETMKLIKTVGELFEDMWKLEFSAMKLWKYFSTPKYSAFEKRMDFCSNTVQKYLEEAMQRLKAHTGDREPTFLEQMLSTSKNPGYIIATITDMFLAGIDTTSNTVGMTLYHMAQNPETQEKAFQEVKATLQKNPVITPETINDIRYLKACVKESMRLSPVVLGSARRMPVDTVLSGYHIPAGNNCFLQNYVAGQHEDNFPEPKRYNPDRFLRDESSHDPFAFLPFGFGPRSCVGRRIAEQEIWTLLLRIVERYRMEYHHEEVDYITRAVVVPDRPLRLQFIDR